MPPEIPVADPGPRSLAELEARLARDLALLNLPAANWVTPRVHPTLGAMADVAIVGAGMAGLAAAFSLIRFGVRNLRLLDAAPPGVEGPWATFARMETLRSPKQLAGPALGLANLSFRAWFEAQFGAGAWEALGRIPRLQWLDYLRWYRRVLDLPVENGVCLRALDGDAEAARLNLAHPDGRTERLAARRVVLATGRDGLGGPFVPALFRDLPRRWWAHSGEAIDFAALAGKRVAVIGAGASAVDNAASALEAGAAHVALLVRRPEVPRINKGMGISSPGVALGFHQLTLEQRWAMTQFIGDSAIPPPRDSMRRASRHANFAVLTGAAVSAARAEGGQLVLETGRGRLAVDFAILATGFVVDWPKRPELAALAPHVLLWRDRYVVAGFETHEMAAHPFLGPALEFVERAPGTAPWVGRVHCFNFAATLSHGKVTGDIPAISFGAERVAEGIAGSLFAEDYEHQHRRLVAYDKPELLGDEWVPGEVAPELLLG